MDVLENNEKFTIKPICLQKVLLSIFVCSFSLLWTLFMLLTPVTAVFPPERYCTFYIDIVMFFSDVAVV